MTENLPLAKAAAAAGASTGRSPGVPILLVAAFSGLVFLGLYGYGLWFPYLFADDLPLLLGSWTWPAAWENLWQPHNEHTLPLGRLSTWLLVQLGAGRLTAMPGLLSLQGPVGVLAGMGLVYCFVRRETGQPFLGVLALTFFGVTTVYNQAVTWFSASFVVLALDTILLALLAAQRWRQTGHWRFLAWCAFWVALAPGWFATGILAGPLCCLYLLPVRLHLRSPEGAAPTATSRAGVIRWLAFLTPLVGTVAFLAVVFTRPDTADRIIHAGHYQGQTAFGIFRPWFGIEATYRALVDHLLLGTIGVGGVACPPTLVYGLLGLMAAGTVWWWWRAPRRRLVLLGLGFILASDLLIYSFREPWGYENMVGWSRYDLLPHLGLTLFLAGGLRGAPGSSSMFLSRRQAAVVGTLLVLLFACHLPRALAISYYSADCWEQQMPVLKRIEAKDERCRQLRISAATAHEALGKLDIPPVDDGLGNGWKFVRGSQEPLPMSVEEARRLLVVP
jgi:hypothetical protein